MRRKKAVKKLTSYCKELKNDDKFIFYQNPKDFRPLKLERVNPTHVGIVWGYNKKNKSFSKIAKVYFSSFIYLFQDLTSFVSSNLLYMLEKLSNDIGVYACLYYIFLSLVFVCIILNIPLIDSIMTGVKSRWI